MSVAGDHAELPTSRLGKEQYDHLRALAANSAGLPNPAFFGLRTGFPFNLPQVRSPTDPSTGGIGNDNKSINPDAPGLKARRLIELLASSVLLGNPTRP
jgi:hypothetical protein